MTLAENEALLQGVVSSEVEIAGSALWNIPVWVTLVRDNNGYSKFNGSFSPSQFVGGVNQYFNNGMAFYVCGVTYVNSSDWYILNLGVTSPGVPSEWTQLTSFVNNQNAAQYDKGYINVS